MSNKMKYFMGAFALVLAIGLNVRHALNEYGVKDNKLHVEVLAQSGGPGGGTTSGFGTGTGAGQKVSDVHYKENGRADVLINDKIQNCRKYIVTCSGSGTTNCPGSLYYDDCIPY